MLGTLVNTGTIIAGTVIGTLVRRQFQDKERRVMLDVAGLAACGVGVTSIVRNLPESRYPVLFIAALAIGSLAGMKLDLDRRFQSLVHRFTAAGTGEGLATAVLLYCIGTLSILGPVRSALCGDNTFLYTNASLDFITSMILGAAYGIGVIWAAAVLFCWQGLIYLGAGAAAPWLQGPLLTELSITGGFLIACSGLSVLKIREFKTVNMLPALLVPPLWFAIGALFK